MKRYGYKFYKLDGTYTEAIDLRYFSVGGGIAFAFFTAFFNTSQALVILSSIPVFWLLGMLSEGWPKTFFHVTSIVCVVFLVISLVCIKSTVGILDSVIGTALSILFFFIYFFIAKNGHDQQINEKGNW